MLPEGDAAPGTTAPSLHERLQGFRQSDFDAGGPAGASGVSNGPDQLGVGVIHEKPAASEGPTPTLAPPRPQPATSEGPTPTLAPRRPQPATSFSAGVRRGRRRRGGDAAETARACGGESGTGGRCRRRRVVRAEEPAVERRDQRPAANRRRQGSGLRGDDSELGRGGGGGSDGVCEPSRVGGHLRRPGERRVGACDALARGRRRRAAAMERRPVGAEDAGEAVLAARAAAEPAVRSGRPLGLQAGGVASHD